jgi:hypothetical protein
VVQPARRFGNWLLLAVGYLLSPVSWWNDAFVNIPIAYLLGNLAGLLHPRLFGPGVVLGYWATNLLGVLLMQQGSARLVGGDAGRPRLRTQLLVASAYTLLILGLLAFGVIRPLQRPAR